MTGNGFDNNYVFQSHICCHVRCAGGTTPPHAHKVRRDQLGEVSISFKRNRATSIRRTRRNIQTLRMSLRHFQKAICIGMDASIHRELDGPRKACPSSLYVAVWVGVQHCQKHILVPFSLKSGSTLSISNLQEACWRCPQVMVSLDLMHFFSCLFLTLVGWYGGGVWPHFPYVWIRWVGRAPPRRR